jgi:predicted secreted hydrolase
MRLLARYLFSVRPSLSAALAWSLSSFLVTVAVVASAAEPVYPDVPTDARFVFPRDHGAHPDFRTEWWYVTGWLKTADGDDVGFQVTFFRSRLPIDDADPSRFAPRQMLFAHAALADPKVGHLLHDERIARAGFGIAEASDHDAAVTLEGWRFLRVPAPVASSADQPSAEPRADALHFRTQVDGDRFAVDLDLQATGTPLAEGADASRPGYSQKGPSPRDASRYYSVPQLRVTGTISRGDARHRRTIAVTGTAWLDREWSSAYLDPRASGWDWVGLNLDDGGALMAFRMRDRSGEPLWAGGTRRYPDGHVERYGPADIRFTTDRTWTSPTSHATWPVAQTIALSRAGSTTTITLEPLMDDQELDSRASTGTIYWEGAVRVHDREANGPVIGKGYLELTGYSGPIRF